MIDSWAVFIIKQWEISITALLHHHYRTDSGSKWQQQHMVAVLGSGVFGRWKWRNFSLYDHKAIISCYKVATQSDRTSWAIIFKADILYWVFEN